MRTKHYKTLAGLLRQTCHGEINLENMKTGMFWHKKLGQIKFTIPFELHEEIYLKMSAAIYSKRSVDIGAKRLALYRGNSTWFYRRLSVNKYGGEYGAAQDWDLETRAIKKYLRG